MASRVYHRESPTVQHVRERQAWVPRVLVGVLALPLLVYAVTGFFARYTADDYCWAGVLRTEGFFKAQALWYTGYSPRYAFTFLVNVVELAGPPIVPALPLVAICLWLGTLAWTFLQFGLRRWPAILLAEVMALGTLETAPDLAQSVYWQTGMLTYLLPLILATFLIGWLRRSVCAGRVRAWPLLISFGIPLVAGGLSETYLIPQNVALTLALVACLVFGRPLRSSRTVLGTHLAAALVGGIVALALIVVSPSMDSRVGGSPADLRLASLAAIATAWYQVLRLARYFPLVLLVALLAPSLLGRPQSGVSRKSFWLVTICVAITVPFCYFASFYAQNGNPPARSLIVPGAIFIGYALFAGYAVAPKVTTWLPEPRRTAIALALALVPVGVALSRLPGTADAAQHAALWDAEDAQIRAARAAGQSDVVVPPLPRYLGEDFVTSDPNDWFNVCVARYYDVRSIATSS